MICIQSLIKKLDKASLSKVSGGRNILYYFGKVKEQADRYTPVVSVLYKKNVYLFKKSDYEFYSDCGITPLLIIRYIKSNSAQQFENREILMETIKYYEDNQTIELEENCKKDY